MWHVARGMTVTSTTIKGNNNVVCNCRLSIIIIIIISIIIIAIIINSVAKRIRE